MKDLDRDFAQRINRSLGGTNHLIQKRFTKYSRSAGDDLVETRPLNRSQCGVAQQFASAGNSNDREEAGDVPRMYPTHAVFRPKSRPTCRYRSRGSDGLDTYRKVGSAYGI